MTTEHFIEIGNKTTGLIVGRNTAAWMRQIQSKSGKKILTAEPNTWNRNQRMLDLAQAGQLPVVLSDEGNPVIYSSGISPITPTKWDNAHERLRTVYYQAAIEHLAKERNELVPFTFHLNLTAEFTRLALRKGGLKYIHGKLGRRLKNALGRKVEFWMAMETVDETKEHLPFTGRPHIHGSILLTREESEGAGRIAIRDLSGEDTTVAFRRTALKLIELDQSKGGGTGHALYATKRREAAALMLPFATLLSCSHGIRAMAKHLYEQDRQALRKVH